jgi:non-specific serine/threonine protein kinase/serine/threonine-protein kinase
MNRSSSQKARQIATQLAEMPTAEQEAALSKLCGDDADILVEVKTLLSAAGNHQKLGDRAAMTADPGSHHQAVVGNRAAVTADPVRAPDPFGFTTHSFDEAPVGEQAGTQIGPYRLIQPIGEGGFGSVFMAEQKKPVARTVALKIIKLGMDTRAVVARFEQERQALALMDHPNIAKVFDAGATSTGRPYFVMEFCRGKPLTEYCDEAKLPIRERLALFVQVCHAVQHAHSKGLIHRDIKPSNILVVDEDGRPVPKVIDFGIAKATGSKLSEMTVYTEHRQMIGTPAYMSPEQAEGSLDIDTRTDVYALGVLLYESLTGETPFTMQSFRSATYADIPKIIREVEPPIPSTRLRQNVTTIARVAAQRDTEPKKLKSMLRGELDWIVMKAVEKDRSRRYDTANSLAMDVERYLKGEAVLAAPPSRVYRLSKFVNRHKGPVVAAAVVALALIGGLIGTTYGLRKAVLARVGETAAKVKAESEAERALKA